MIHARGQWHRLRYSGVERVRPCGRVERSALSSVSDLQFAVALVEVRTCATRTVWRDRADLGNLTSHVTRTKYIDRSAN